MIAKLKAPRTGVQAAEFLIDTPAGRVSLLQLAARHEKLVLTSQDSYRYHPN